MVSKDDPPAIKCLEEFLRTHISDEKTLEEGLSLLRFLRTERASFFVGVYATLEYMLEHNGLPKEERPSPQVCLAPEVEAAEDRNADGAR
jgi:hypothetical protein